MGGDGCVDTQTRVQQDREQSRQNLCHHKFVFHVVGRVSKMMAARGTLDRRALHSWGRATSRAILEHLAPKTHH